MKLPPSFIPITLVISLSAATNSTRVVHAQKAPIVWTDQEKPIVQKIRSLRSLADDQRATLTKTLALEIRRLPALTTDSS